MAGYSIVPEMGGFPPPTLTAQTRGPDGAGFPPTGQASSAAPDLGGFTPAVSPISPIWTPAQIPSLWAWFDVSDASTVTLSGSNVTQVNDKSGNGNHATQAVAANQFVIMPGIINGLDAMRQTATSVQYMTFPGLSTNNPVSIFWIGKPTAASRLGPTCLAAASGNGALAWGFSAANQLIVEVSATRVLVLDVTTAYYPPSKRYGTVLGVYDPDGPLNVGFIHDNTVNATQPKLRVFQNGKLMAQTSIGSAPSGLSFNCFGRAAPSVNVFDGAWGEAILVNGAISDLDLAQWFQYCRMKWGSPS